MIHDPIPISRAERRRTRTRGRILATAREIVREGGLDALTIHELARRLDYTPGALYRYFGGRDDLLVAMQLEVLDSWGVALREVRARCTAASVDDPAAAALLPVFAIAALFGELAARQPGRFALISNVLGLQRHLLDDETAAAMVPPLLALLGGVAGALEGAQARALSPGDASQRAVLLLASLQGLLQLRKLERLAPTALTPVALAPSLVRTLLRGWGAAEPALDAAERSLADLVAHTPLLDPGDPE